MCSRIWHYSTRERDKRDRRVPLVNPRGPAKKSVLRTALTSRPPACGRLNSTSLSRFASGRHPWRPALVIRSPVRRFQRGIQHPCHIQAAESPEGGRVRQKIAEALTAGRGEAQGCAERARLTGTLHRARPDSRREKAEGTAKRRFSLPGAGVARGAASPPGTFTAAEPA
jgi:hypothetical protein